MPNPSVDNSAVEVTVTNNGSQIVRASIAYIGWTEPASARNVIGDTIALLPPGSKLLSGSSSPVKSIAPGETVAAVDLNQPPVGITACAVTSVSTHGRIGLP